LRNDSGIIFEVCITNPFKKAIKINSLNLELISKENNKLIFDCEEANLEPGKNTIQLKCEHPISGKYNAKAIQFSINKFILKSAIHQRINKTYTVKETSSTLLIKACCVQPIEYEKPSIPNFSGGVDFESPYVNIDTKESLKSKGQGKIKLEAPKDQKTKETAPSISINKPKKPTTKEVKVAAPRISLKAPEINKKSKETSLEIEGGK